MTKRYDRPFTPPPYRRTLPSREDIPKLSSFSTDFAFKMDWQQKFSSLAKETECNLTRVKNQLYTTQYTAAPKLLNNGATADGQLQYIPLDQSPGIIVLLQERLDDQAKAIENLTKAVRSLQDERENNRRTIRQLQGELRDIKDHLTEKAIGFHDDRKLEQWRHAMTDDMQGLQNQLQLYHARSNDNSTMTLNNELYESRRMMREECEEFRRELDTVKSGLMRLQLQFASHDGENRELLRSQDQLNRTMKNIIDIQNITTQELRVTKDFINGDKAQLEHLHNCCRGLREKLGSLQRCPSDSNSQASYPRCVKIRHRNQQTSSLLTDLNSPNYSESESDIQGWSHLTRRVKNKPPNTIDNDLGLSDSDDTVDAKRSDILPPPKEYSEQKDLSSDDDNDEDYLLSDLNLSLEDISSTEEPLFDSDLV
ncbi:hypothetical protein LSH36_737g05080 [Paralvinella palmiformis]|uniref:Uncharacterized protein n=1 Tax=Paralvinella palmiformis TaxID=53620 RepID=A0AAD9J123_9ANNE|nr:hypothetical protein LSH36_737g05080 [Paralvinella palmiformis]